MFKYHSLTHLVREIFTCSPLPYLVLSVQDEEEQQKRGETCHT